jgi:hypothetical protein
MLIDVKVKPEKDGYDAQNSIKKHLPASGQPAPAQTGFQKPAGGQGSEAPKKAQPWHK